MLEDIVEHRLIDRVHLTNSVKDQVKVFSRTCLVKDTPSQSNMTTCPGAVFLNLAKHNECLLQDPGSRCYKGGYSSRCERLKEIKNQEEKPRDDDEEQHEAESSVEVVHMDPASSLLSLFPLM